MFDRGSALSMLEAPGREQALLGPKHLMAYAVTVVVLTMLQLAVMLYPREHPVRIFVMGAVGMIRDGVDSVSKPGGTAERAPGRVAPSS